MPKNTCVSPLESKISIENKSEHGVVDGLVVTCCTLARISPRVLRPALENGRLTVAILPLPTVKAVAVPIVAPVALANVTVPVPDGAGALAVVGIGAMLTRLTAAVSPLAKPTGGKQSPALW